jgi:hypothetical protein
VCPDKGKDGCDVVLKDPRQAIHFDGEDYRQCPVRLVRSRTRHAVQLVGLLESGSWPVSGGVLDQANAFLQAACIVTAARADERERKDKSRGK